MTLHHAAGCSCCGTNFRAAQSPCSPSRHDANKLVEVRVIAPHRLVKAGCQRLAAAAVQAEAGRGSSSQKRLKLARRCRRRSTAWHRAAQHMQRNACQLRSLQETQEAEPLKAVAPHISYKTSIFLLVGALIERTPAAGPTVTGHHSI